MIPRRLLFLGAALTAMVVASGIGAAIYHGERSGRQGVYETDPVASPDRLEIEARIQRIDAAAGDVVLRVLVIPRGALSDGADTLIPTRDIVVESNSLTKGVLRFPAHERIARQDLTVDLVDGVVTDYPFDRYKAFAAFSASAGDASVPVVLTVDDTDHFFASRAILSTDAGLTGFRLGFRRSQATLVLAGFMFFSMWALALSVFAGAWLLTSRRRGMVWPALGWMAATLFALAGFRTTTPGSPPFGCLLDYTAFLWAEGIIALAIVLVVVRGIHHEVAAETEAALSSQRR